MRTEIAADAAEILKASSLDVVPYADRIEALADRLGIDFSATLFALNQIPLCQSRARHPASRRAMAEMIAGRTEFVRAALPDLLSRSLAPLKRPGSVDVMAQVVTPLVSEMIGLINGVPFDANGSVTISRIFSQAMGVSRRKRMELELATLTADLRRALPEADDDLIGLKLSLTILGRDALMGTLSCSLLAMVEGAPGQPFSAMDWPDIPPRTGVPYIDRVALSEVSVGGNPVAAGETIRARLADYEDAADPRARLSFFGAGAHLCLGRALSLDLWRGLVADLAACPLVPRLTAFTLRRDDVFHLPETFTLEIMPQ